MVRWLANRPQTRRSRFAVRLGLWRGQWRHSVVQVSAVPFAFNPLVPHAWRYSLYAPGGLADDSAAPLIIVPGLSHEWTGGPGGHRLCVPDGCPLTELCGQFLADPGVLPRGRTLTLPRWWHGPPLHDSATFGP